MHGVEGSVSMTFFETGRTRLPELKFNSRSAGEVGDSVDAHYLFAFLKRELSADAADL